MVKIKRGTHETMVAMSSFKDIFEPLGYTIVQEKKEMPKNKITEPVKEPGTVKDNKGNGKKQED